MNIFGDIKTVGLIGGLGPETTSEFYLKLIEKSKKYCNAYPSVLIDSISFPFCLEKEIIQDSKNERMILPLLKQSIIRLNRAGADFITIPCNSVHIFIEELMQVSSAPLISIIDETVNCIINKNYKKVGLLATSKTVDSKLYEKPLSKNGIKVIVPSKEEQRKVSEIIIRILRRNVEASDKLFLKNIVENMVQRGSEAIILGCTDLQLILKQKRFSVELLDSMEILVNSIFEKLFNFKGDNKR